MKSFAAEVAKAQFQMEMLVLNKKYGLPSFTRPIMCLVAEEPGTLLGMTDGTFHFSVN